MNLISDDIFFLYAQKLMAILKECIVKASEIGATSLALPAVGMGVKGYPSKRVAEVTLQAVKSFTDENPDSALTMIKLYLHQPSLKPSQILVGLNFNLRQMMDQ